MLLEGFFSIVSNILLFTSKIDSNNSFPQPLTPQKEKEYLAKYKAGDMEARDILIKHNLRLVAFIAKKYTNYPDQDELISIGSLGLIKAIASYEEKKGTALATYASRCIENEILMTLRSYKKTASNVSIYESVGTDKNGNDMTLIDLLKVDEEEAFKKADRDILRETIEKLVKENLTARETTVIVARYGLKDGEPHSQQEIAEKLGISRSYISRIEKKALEKIRAAVERDKIEF